MFMPENIIIRYLWEQFKTQAPNFYSFYAPTIGGPDHVPFYPAGTGNIPSDILEEDKPYFVFDKFTKVRTGSYKYFYPMKSDQMRLTIYGGTLPNYPSRYIEEEDGKTKGPFGYTPNYSFDRYAYTINMTSLITMILDREDAAAEDINEFAMNSIPGYADQPDELKYYFHCINVFQSGYAESQQDVANLMEYRPTRDLIIKYDYHSKQYNTDIQSPKK
jgi:hypothetical protein